MMRILFVLVLLLLPLRPAAAQEIPANPVPAGPELVDRVIAVVGDTALLLSDLRTAVQRIQAQGQTIPTDPAQRDAFMQRVLEEQVNALLLVEAARDAGITVDEDQITRLVDASVAQTLQGFGGSQQRLEQALAQDNMTLTQYREVLANQARDDQLMRSYMSERMRARARPVISEDEIRETFESIRPQLGQRPARVTFRQIFIQPTPSDSADAAARREAEDVLKQLNEGGEWEVLARRFSDDPGSKEQGGNLGWFRQDGSLVPEFERAMFATRPGLLTPVKSSFGYHILEVRRVQGPERQVRHILIKPEITDADVERARVRADSVAEALRNGANFLTLARQYRTPENEIDVPPQNIDQLPEPYEALRTAQTGEVAGPFLVPRGGDVEWWAVVRVSERREAGEYTLEDQREEIIRRLQEDRMISQIVEDLRGQIHVAIRM